jgi:tRNA-dihydrouridine synthase
MNFWQELPKPFFVLAPMDDVTDVVFRQLVDEIAPPDIFFTEFVSTDGLQSAGRERTSERLRISPRDTRPLVAQIWGKDPQKYEQTAAELKDQGFAGIDINFGCPEKGIVARGCCGGMIGNLELAGEIIAATKRGAGQLPVSVKTRVGLNKIITEEWCGWLLEQDLAALTIHGRTVREMSKVPAHWDEIAKVVKLRNEKNLTTPIIGNGDILTRDHGLKLAQESGVDGLMIGRGIFHDIDIFRGNVDRRSPHERLQILNRHLELYEEWGSTKPFQVLKKFFKIYVAGWPNAAELRSELMECTSPDEVRALLETVDLRTEARSLVSEI